jgi:hypothetical protein
MTAAQITALVVAFLLASAIAGSLSSVTVDSDPALVIRAIDNNAAYPLALRDEEES